LDRIPCLSDTDESVGTRDRRGMATGEASRELRLEGPSKRLDGLVGRSKPGSSRRGELVPEGALARIGGRKSWTGSSSSIWRNEAELPVLERDLGTLRPPGTARPAPALPEGLCTVSIHIIKQDLASIPRTKASLSCTA
jgi:hypothetical protein